MANLLKCEIVTPDQMLYSGDAVLVSAPAAEGEIGLMYMCSPITSTLKRGLVRVKETDSGESRKFAVNGGYLEADGRKIVVLASKAIDLEVVDITISNDRIASNEKRLTELAEDDSRAVFIREEIVWQKYLAEKKKEIS